MTRCAAGQVIVEVLARRAGEQYLPAVPDCQQSRDAVERRTEVISVALVCAPLCSAMRTASPSIALQSSAASARCARLPPRRHPARENAAQNASPTVLKT